MRSRNLIPLFLLSAALTGGASASACRAQTASTPEWREWRELRLDNGWFESENAAGLLAFDAGALSEVTLGGTLEQGGLKPYYASEEVREFGAGAASLCRLSERVAVRGEVSYRRLSAKRLAGSYFIDPTETPFDLVEYTDENPGDKQLEEYRIFGGVGARLARGFALGVSFDYTAADYAKHKDLRHTNSLMDLVFVFGGAFRLGERVSLGIDYRYRRRNETLLLSSYGTQDKRFVSLLDYGAFFGKQEIFGEVGYTKENENKPLFEEYRGAALQLSWRIADRLAWFCEAGFRRRSGYYGDPSHATVVYAEHEGGSLFCKGVLTLSGSRSAHTLLLDWSRDQVENVENIYVYRNEETGRSYIEYLGEREVGERTRRSLKARYTGRFGLLGGLPRWQASLEASLDRRETKASNYPDYRRQTLTWWRVTASAARNIPAGRNCYTVSLSGSCGAGAGAACRDGRYASADGSEALTRTRDDLLMQEWEYLTAPRAGAGIDAGYSRLLGDRGYRICVALRCELHKAFDTGFSGDAMRRVVSLRLGCRF